MDIEALVIGITNVFLNNSDLLAALGGAGSSVTENERMFDTKADDDVESPYAVFQYIAGDDDLTFTEIQEVITWQFSIFNKTSSPLDKRTINDVFKKLIAAYDQSEATMSVSGYTVVYVTRGVSSFLPTEDDIQQYIINYEIMIEKSR